MPFLDSLIRRFRWAVVTLGLLSAMPVVLAQSQSLNASDRSATQEPQQQQQPGGPIRLRPNGAPLPALGASSVQRPFDRDGSGLLLQPAPPYVPGDFEVYVERLANLPPDAAPIRRFGANLLLEPPPDARDLNAQVPADYLVQPGDEVVLTLWGSVDADLRLTVDRSGRISIPRVGAVAVAGVKQSDLNDVVGRRVAQVFKNFQISTSLGQLRGIRVYIAGYVARPGSITVSSLSTLVNALMRSGGPSAAGSFRNVQLRRGRELITSFDLYDLLLKGDRSADRVLQADDVIYVGAVGPQVALIGSVNQPAIFELKSGETINDLLQMAGGFTAVADTTRVAIERLDERNTVRITQIELPAAQATPLRNGDVLRAFNSTAVALPVQRQNKRVRVEGEVMRPGEFVLPARSSVGDALRAAGGLTPAAYVFGTEFSRESVRVTQQQNYERALRDLETEVVKASSTQRTGNADEAAAQTARVAGTQRLVERLRAVRPTGRVVLQLAVDSTALPDLALEDGDRIYIPPRPTTVGVFGSVFNGGSYLYSDRRSIDDYLRLAGGPTRGADQRSVFVVRANGSVVSSQQQGGGWFGGKADLASVQAVPGDTVFVPEEINKTTLVQDFKDWTQILYQFGLGLAGFKAVGAF
ncbi:MAG: SLBB domain-containing protein [Ideonella sp.]|nr:SLBB domain-containing protein [Ideonella sp.]MCC7456912.1 SLBB domain-containing protein [Nitrospira sp.]